MESISIWYSQLATIVIVKYIINAYGDPYIFYIAVFIEYINIYKILSKRRIHVFTYMYM